jgi:hypothetical protein
MTAQPAPELPPPAAPAPPPPCPPPLAAWLPMNAANAAPPSCGEATNHSGAAPGCRYWKRPHW